MIRIGITGGIGSGKSTVCKHLESKGAIIFDADLTATLVMEQEASVRKAIIDLMGPFAYKVDGTLDKRFISERIFSDDIARKRVGEIVHPIVQARFVSLASAQDLLDTPAVVREAALLPNKDAKQSLDQIWVVEAPQKIREERVAARNRIPTSAVRDRMDAQPSHEEYRAIADVILVNEGTLEELHGRVDEVWKSMLDNVVK